MKPKDVILYAAALATGSAMAVALVGFGVATWTYNQTIGRLRR